MGHASSIGLGGGRRRRVSRRRQVGDGRRRDAARGTGRPEAPRGPDRQAASAATSPAGTSDKIVVEFNAKADLRAANKVKDHAKRGQAVLDALTATAGTSQRSADAPSSTRPRASTATSYWLNNVMVVDGRRRRPSPRSRRSSRASRASRASAPRRSTRWSSRSIRRSRSWPPPATRNGASRRSAPTRPGTTGILGQGVVVANVDTGVDYTHPALVEHYRGNNDDGDVHPRLQLVGPDRRVRRRAVRQRRPRHAHDGHDGRRRRPGPFTPDIGVAPGRPWIAAKGCEDFGCSEIVAAVRGPVHPGPDRPRPARTPPARAPPGHRQQLVGRRPRRPVLPGDGPGLARRRDHPGLLVRATPARSAARAARPATSSSRSAPARPTIDDNIADFSGRGPSVFGKINPDVSAPGVDVVSSVPGGGYEAFSGTSMAAPHTAGTIALILSAEPALLGDLGNFATGHRRGPRDRRRPHRPDLRRRRGRRPEQRLRRRPHRRQGRGRPRGHRRHAVRHRHRAGDRRRRSPAPSVTADDGTRTSPPSTDANGDYDAVPRGRLVPGHRRRRSATSAGIASGVVIVDRPDHRPGLLARRCCPASPCPARSPRPRTARRSRAPPSRAIGTPGPAGHDRRVAATTRSSCRSARTRSAPSADGCTETGEAEIVSAERRRRPGLRAVPQARRLRPCLRADPVRLGRRDRPDGARTATTFAGRLRLPFSFPFYGEPYDAVFLSDNGYLNFLEPEPVQLHPVGHPVDRARRTRRSTRSGMTCTSTQAAAHRLRADRRRARTARSSSSTRTSRRSASTVTLDFEVKLWENGTIDLLYGPNPAEPG